MIIDHTNLMYLKKWEYAREHRFNGAYYYSKEIVKNIIPRVKTDRNWVTINVPGAACHHSVVFIHDNLSPFKSYLWLNNSRDLVLVCGVEETMNKVRHLGTPVYLPLSVDVPYVSQFKTEKTKDTAYVGRKGKPGTEKLPKDIDYISGLPRVELLKELAKYKKVYAVGRCAIEARVLGCEILPFDERYPDPSVWKILDNKMAAKMLQLELDKIDKRRKND
jgi:hypothetical protein